MKQQNHDLSSPKILTLFKQKKILVAPLDWGLGHTTRCVPLIERLISEGHQVLIAANGSSAAYLKKRFPHLSIDESIPAYNVTYPDNGNMLAHFMKDTLRLLSVIKAEHQWLDDFIREKKPDLVYSDNRYGLYSKHIDCFLITHQLFIRVPFLLKPLVNFRVRAYIKLFKECLVPDFEGTQNLSGALSHATGLPRNVKFIGPLSRFKAREEYHVDESAGYHFVAIVSGPEPQRSYFQELLTTILENIGRPSLIVCGQPEKTYDEQHRHLRIVSHLDDDALAKVILECRTLICRSGYSTIMDLDKLKKQAIIIPTPGQSEQEYLAYYHHRAGRHYTISQKHLTKDRILNAHRKIDFLKPVNLN